jgi:hypothetical protein
MGRWLVLAILSLAPSTWAAASPWFDVIVQTDGTVLQGHVAELVPGRSVTLMLLTGETRMVPWEQIASKSGPSFAPAPPRPDDDAAPDADRRPGPGRVALRVESTGPALDVGRTGDVAVGGAYFGRTRRLGCTTPCTLYLLPGPLELYAARASLHSATATLPLQLPADGLQVLVRPDSPGRLFLGINVLTLSLGLVLGPVFISTGATDPGPMHGMAEAGWTLLGVGLAATGAGVALIATSTTRVLTRRAFVNGKAQR